MSTARPDGGSPEMESRGSVPAGPRSYEGVWRFTVPALDASVPRTRRAVRELLERQRLPVGGETAHGVLLVLSELLTNAVRHAALLSPEIAVEIAVGTGWIRVSVEDDHPYRPTALETDPARTGGRGLLLVRELTREAGGGFGAEHTAGGGKTVWAVLPFDEARTEPPGPVEGPEPVDPPEHADRQERADQAERADPAPRTGPTGPPDPARPGRVTSPRPAP